MNSVSTFLGVIDVGVVGDADLHVDPSGVLLGDVGDARSGDLAVGDDGDPVVHGDQGGGHQVDALDEAFSAAADHVITLLEGLVDHDQDAAGKVGQGALKSQGDRCACRREDGQKAAGVEAEDGHDGDDDLCPADDLDHVADELVEHRIEAGLLKALLDCLDDEVDGDASDDVDQKRLDDLQAQSGQGRQIDCTEHMEIPPYKCDSVRIHYITRHWRLQ